MKTINFCRSVVTGAICLLSAVLAQDIATHGTYTEPNTGMKFYTSSQKNSAVPGQMLDGNSQGGFTEGVILPPNAATTNVTEFIGLIIGSTPTGANNGWAGVIQGTDDADGNMSAAMIKHLMVVAFPTGNGNQISATLRYSVAYENPIPYQGTAKLTQLYSKVNSTHWTLIYRCEGCFTFNDPSLPTQKASTAKGTYLKGWAQSLTPVNDRTNPNSGMLQHDNGCGWFQVIVSSAVQSSYSQWATATTSTTTTSAPVTTTTTTTTSIIATAVPTGLTYDYIVIGTGAGGIPVAEKLAASGKSVLLIEKGVASSARHGGTIRPPSGWLDGKNLTWFDVPGQCNRIWNGGSAGVACTDIDQMAGCILGGGTAINAGLWWKPNPKDWDYNFPAGWKAADMVAATGRVFSRIPGTDLPSMDGKRYILEGFNVIKSGLAAAGWKSVTANNSPGEKNRTYSYTPYMYSNGERGGPQATYLVSSKARSNFKLWLNTTVERINRTGGHATGLVVKATNNGGYVGEIKLTPITGRVILSAGAFGTPKLLFRSGIGPLDQLNVVKNSTEGATMINSNDWINTPVGYNLDDHLNTDLVISHPSVVYYDWPASWTTPIAADKNLYFNSRSGPFAQAAPNIGPIMFEEIKGPDNIVRQFQWSSRVEGSRGQPNGQTMTLSVYLGRGKLARGRATISSRLNMEVTKIPYGEANDMATVAKAIDNMVAALKPVKNLTWILPPPGQSGSAYLASIPLTINNVGERRANHWMGTAKLGTDSGPQGGTSVVDLDTKVYGTDNIFVVDASIFPGMVSNNPSALIVVAAERASERILALPVSVGVAKYGQCGGVNYSGSMVCATGSVCKFQNPYYSQCL